MQNDDTYVFGSWYESTIGATLIGCGVGLYERIAYASLPAAPRYCTVHLFFTSVLALVVTPYLMFPSVVSQIRQEHQSDFINGKIDPLITASYYENRGSVMLYFVINGLLITLVIFSITNALQHPGLRESGLNSYFTIITLICSFSLDNWVLQVDKDDQFFTKGVVGLVFALLVGYFCLQSYKHKSVKEKVHDFIFN